MQERSKGRSTQVWNGPWRKSKLSDERSNENPNAICYEGVLRLQWLERNGSSKVAGANPRSQLGVVFV